MTEAIVQPTPEQLQFSSSSPDVSDFSTDLVTWSMHMSNEIVSDDYLNLVFTGVPLYRGSSLGRDTGIELVIPGLGRVNLIVREIDYSLDANGAKTSVTAATQKIALDSVIVGGLNVPGENPRMETVVRAILSVLGIDLELDIDPELKWGSKAVISGVQTAYSFIQSKINNNGMPIANFWIDAFGTLHIQPRDGGSSDVVTMGYSDAKRQLLRYHNRVFWDFKKKDSTVTWDGSTPAAEPGNLVKNAVIDIDPNSQDVYLQDGTRSKNRKGISDTPSTPNIMNRTIVEQSIATISMAGIYNLLPHQKVKLVNWPHGNEPDYIVKSVDINDNGGGNIITNINLATVASTIDSPSNVNTKQKADRAGSRFVTISINREDIVVGTEGLR